jgi:hypothetical protein
MNSEEKIKKLIEESKIKSDAQTEQKILGDAFEHLEKLQQQKSPLIWQGIWRIIMKNKKTRLAAMVAIIFVITIVLCQFDQTSIALGQVKSAIHSRLLYLRELVAGTNKPVPSPLSGQRGGRGFRRPQRISDNKTPAELSNNIIINLLFLTIEGKRETLYDFFNKEKIKLNIVQNNPEIWYTKLVSSQIERFKELAYTIDVPKLRAEPKIGLKDGQEGILRSSGDAKDFAFSIVTNVLHDVNSIEMSLVSLFGESEMEIPSIKTASDEAVLFCLTKSLTSNNEPNNIPEKKISTLVLIQAKEELPK